MAKMKVGQPWLYDDTTGDIIGIKDPDGSDNLFVTVNSLPAADAQIFNPRAAPYKIACFGDSRAVAGSVVYPYSAPVADTTYLLVSIKVPMPLCFWLGCADLIFQGGISGDTVTQMLAATRGTNQSYQDCIKARPDAVYIQAGVNDILSWNGSGYAAARDTLILNCKRLASVFLNSGIPVIWEATNPCNDVAVGPLVPGYSSAGGYGANAAQKAQMTAELNDAMQAFALNARSMMVFSNTYAYLLDTDRILGVTSVGTPYGYAKADGSAQNKYGDGTHIHGTTAFALAKKIAEDTRSLLPNRAGSVFVPAITGSYVNGQMLNPTGGLAENAGLAAAAFSVGAGTVTYATGIERGMAYQEIVVTPTSLGANSECSFTIQLAGAPIGGGTPTWAVAANDVTQGQAWLYADDGAGGAPAGLANLLLRQRYYYNPTGGVYCDVGERSSTFPPAWSTQISGFVFGRYSTPVMKSAQASAGIFDLSNPSKTGLFLLGSIIGSLASVRIRAYMPFLGKIA